jgi:hypothetical protein
LVDPCALGLAPIKTAVAHLEAKALAVAGLTLIDPALINEVIVDRQPRHEKQGFAALIRSSSYH